MMFVNQISGSRESHEASNIVRSKNMLYWAVVFFIVALVAALFGFGGIAAGAASIAQILFFLFIVLFVISLIVHLAKGRTPRTP